MSRFSSSDGWRPLQTDYTLAYSSLARRVAAIKALVVDCDNIPAAKREVDAAMALIRQLENPLNAPSSEDENTSTGDQHD